MPGIITGLLGLAGADKTATNLNHWLGDGSLRKQQEEEERQRRMREAQKRVIAQMMVKQGGTSGLTGGMSPEANAAGIEFMTGAPPPPTPMAPTPVSMTPSQAGANFMTGAMPPPSTQPPKATPSPMVGQPFGGQGLTPAMIDDLLAAGPEFQKTVMQFLGPKEKPKRNTTTVNGVVIDTDTGKPIYEAPQTPEPDDIRDVNGGIYNFSKQEWVEKPPAPTDPVAQARAEAMAKKEGEQTVKTAHEQRENQQSYGTFKMALDEVQTAFNAMQDGLLGTGPIAGLTAGMFTDGQNLNSAVSAMAPLLKQLFRSAGEGQFTDRDQQLLLDMIPTATTRPEAAKAAIDRIDKIVRSKLGLGAGEYDMASNQAGVDFMTGGQGTASVVR